MLRSVTRLSHASGNVVLDELPEAKDQALFRHHGQVLDTMEGPIINLGGAIDTLHNWQHEKLRKASEIFENCPFNTYTGPDRPELLLITSSACHLYAKEAIFLIGLQDRVGLLKLGTTWPLPARILEKYLGGADKVLIVEEVLPFIEDNIRALAASLGSRIGCKTFFGKNDGSIPMTNELNPDLVVTAIARILNVEYESIPEAYKKMAEQIAAEGAPPRAPTFCPGCPHRASFWSIHNALQLDNRDGFVCGDIGCYSLGALPCGFDTSRFRTGTADLCRIRGFHFLPCRHAGARQCDPQ